MPEDQKNLKFGYRHRLMPSLLSINEYLALEIKNYAKTDIKGFWSWSILLSFFTFLNIGLASQVAERLNPLSANPTKPFCGIGA